MLASGEHAKLNNIAPLQMLSAANATYPSTRPKALSTSINRGYARYRNALIVSWRKITRILSVFAIR